MSILSFLSRRSTRAPIRQPLSITDIIHRTFVSGLAGLTLYGLFLGVAVHRETLAKGRELMVQRDAEVAVAQPQDVADEVREQALAEAAQSVLFTGSKS
ncbi:hypothetical protein SERLA73DRAFT_178726 [Serpula lacrymans var. lacrymans S7.3]|uniref:Uncharacterized protein n=1 Tax=Serpula lacrymans var. lacrymans (strain S7.3) TaxID=936435 RepID=F8PSM7_SERL3|nr:hypothetical protein SERLA73DRAFT_178726 [Serpula lacrymans var. lacrymans S7.3]